MRKIEKQMLEAISTRRESWQSDNTGVFYETAGNPYGPRSEIYLHGNHIADFWHNSGELDVDVRTLARWPSNTTKSRLRALGANITTKARVTYLDGKPLSDHLKGE